VPVYEAISCGGPGENRGASIVLFSDKRDWPRRDRRQRVHFCLTFRGMFGGTVDSLLFAVSTIKIATCSQPQHSKAGQAGNPSNGK